MRLVIFSLVVLTLLLIPCLITCQTTSNGIPWSTDDATEDDQENAQVTKRIIEPLIVRFTTDSVRVGPTHTGNTYQRMRLTGSGTFWRTVSNVDGIWIDLRSNANYTAEEYRQMGIIKTAERITYNITYHNQLDDSFELVHAHGQTAANWRVDGVPLLTDIPLAPGEIRTYTYDIPISNAGTYFLHSHWGFNGMQGMHAPLVIQTDVPPQHQLAKELNDPKIKEMVFYLEDWCLQFANGDDPEADNSDYENKADINRQQYLCENPMIAYRGMWGEWNSQKRAEQTPELDRRAAGQPFTTCEEPTEASEFTHAYYFANGRTYDDAHNIRVNVDEGEEDAVRLRIINAASMTTFRITVPDQFEKVTIVAVDGRYIEPYQTNELWCAPGQRYDIYFIVANEAKPTEIINAYQEAPIPPSNLTDPLVKYSNSTRTGIYFYKGTVASNTDYIEQIPGVGILSQMPHVLVKQETSFHALPLYGLNWTLSQADRIFYLDLNGYNGIRGINGLGWQVPPIIPLDRYTRNPQPYRVNKGDKVCMIIRNYDHEVHPIHLHGHTFQVLNINGVPVRGAMRDTVQVPASCGNVTICFNADAAPGSVHSLHCHMSIHEMSGMHTTIEYDGYVPIMIPSTFTLDAANYSASLLHPPRIILNGTIQYITNIYTDGVEKKDVTNTGLGVGLALGLALLISWIFFGCGYYRYTNAHQYVPHSATHRPSISQAQPSPHHGKFGRGPVPPAHGDMESSATHA